MIHTFNEAYYASVIRFVFIYAKVNFMQNHLFFILNVYKILKVWILDAFGSGSNHLLAF